MLQVTNLQKSFQKREVVKGISFAVEKGESFGLLGPNGAGKSTTISMICGLLKMDEGDVLVNNASVKSELKNVKKKIGVVPQEIALYPTLSAKDNLLFWGKMYGLSSKAAKQKADEILELIGLSDRAKDKVETFSGGMKRRVNIGVALMHEPELLIMDEPTVGIDPQSRNHILETVKTLNEKGMTVIYTSHYMEEVEYLCKRIGIIDHGELIALGTKSDLITRLSGGKMIEVSVKEMREDFLQSLQEVESVTGVNVMEDGQTLQVVSYDSDKLLPNILELANSYHIAIQAIQIIEPNLETVFLQLTGRTLRD
ncbi:ABC transporter ATP-binding protein [Bacillus sp. HMF5848]|uniref:ABC transporter ATP-binding protein n=1 Tax=Bacillus sp. HMF5848 TaxID=2495421 RepID=UPI000F77B82F|nr:ABC transporter ATP-binding protein [Bacillus sp. HMF5848]RSK26060.1 ABC transporter ATP-binding protein [Bacillus sp. HMF5848]